MYFYLLAFTTVLLWLEGTSSKNCPVQNMLEHVIAVDSSFLGCKDDKIKTSPVIPKLIFTQFDNIYLICN